MHAISARVCVGILKERSAQRQSIDGHEAYVWTYAWSDLTFLVLVVLERELVQLDRGANIHSIFYACIEKMQKNWLQDLYIICSRLTSHWSLSHDSLLFQLF